MRAIIHLTKEQQKELQKLKKKEKNSKIYRRYLYVEMSSAGLTNLQISSILGICNDTLTGWKYIFEQEGLKGLSRLDYKGRRESKLKPYLQEIKQKIKENMISTIGELQEIIVQEYNIVIENSWLYRLCKKNSIYLTKKQD